VSAHGGARVGDPLTRLRASLSRGDGRRAVAGCLPRTSIALRRAKARPAPTEENAGGGPPSPPRGRGQGILTRLTSPKMANLRTLSPKGGEGESPHTVRKPQRKCRNSGGRPLERPGPATSSGTRAWVWTVPGARQRREPNCSYEIGEFRLQISEKTKRAPRWIGPPCQCIAIG
jgi:hypothetical protein